MSDPNVKDGIEYWNTQPASLDGVLGGFGSGVRKLCFIFTNAYLFLVFA